MKQWPLPAAIARAMCAGAILLAAPRAVAQTVPPSPPASQSSHDPATTMRVAAVTDAMICKCIINGQPAPSTRRLLILAIGKQWELGTSADGRFALAYAPEVLPLILSHGTAQGDFQTVRCGTVLYCTGYVGDPWRANAVGAGILPLALVGRASLWPRVRVQARLSGGALRMSQAVPYALGRKFNFIAEAGTLVAVDVSRHLTLTSGVVLNHISNGGTGEINPGQNARMFELGVAVKND